MDPQDHQHLFLGAANGWIYDSRDGGASWHRLAQIERRDDLVLDSIVVDPERPQRIIVGAWVLDRPDGGLFVSEDGGRTWINQADMRGQSVRSLAISPSDPRIVLAGTLQGVFRSIDRGAHWTRISPAENGEIHEIQSVAVDPKDPQVIYAGTWHLPWKTLDGGEHWSSIKQGIIDDSDVFSIIVDPTKPQVVYASACSGIYKSTDGGALFQKVQGIPSTARRTRVLIQDPKHLDTVFAGTTEGLFRTDDAGKIWARLTGPEVIVNDVTIDPANPLRVLIATNRGGVLASDDGGTTFRSSNQGFSARQITTLLRDTQHPNTLYAGVVNDKEWGGVFESENGGINWVQRSEGLQASDVFSLGQAPDGTIVAGTAHGIYRFAGAGDQWQRVAISVNLPAPAAVQSAAPATLRAPVVIAKNQFAHSKAGRSKIHATTRPRPSAARNAKTVRAVRNVKSSKGTKTLRPAKSVPTGRAKKIDSTVKSATVISPKPPLLPVSPPFDAAVYAIVTSNQSLVAATSGALLSSSDNGASWKQVGPQFTVGWRLAASARQNVVAATLHALLFSADTGASWAPIRLPEQISQLSAIAVEPSGEIWAGSREGLFTTSDGGNTWSNPTGIYEDAVNSLYYDEATARLVVASAGTHGAIFTIKLPERALAYYESGWGVRLARPLGRQLIAATLFDGVIIQPLSLPSTAAPALGSTAQGNPGSPQP